MPYDTLQVYHNDDSYSYSTYQYQDTNRIGFTEIAFSESAAASDRSHRLIWSMVELGSIRRQNL